MVGVQQEIDLKHDLNSFIIFKSKNQYIYCAIYEYDTNIFTVLVRAIMMLSAPDLGWRTATNNEGSKYHDRQHHHLAFSVVIFTT